MSHYKSNLRDIEFNLFEVFGAGDWMGTDAFRGHGRRPPRTSSSRPTSWPPARTGSDHARQCDRNPPVYDPKTYSVTMPEDPAFLPDADGRRRLADGDPARDRWHPDAAEPALGRRRTGPRRQPRRLHVHVGPGFAGILYDLGNEVQKKQAERMIEGQWGATMVLTEPDAGSDVGAGTTKAFPNEDGSWRIEGVKRFITSAEHDMSDNIIHLVLARPVGVEGAGGPGTKGSVVVRGAEVPLRPRHR